MKRKTNPIHKAHRRNAVPLCRPAVIDARKLPFTDPEAAKGFCEALEWFLAKSPQELLVCLHRAFVFKRDIYPLLRTGRP